VGKWRVGWARPAGPAMVHPGFSRAWAFGRRRNDDLLLARRTDDPPTGQPFVTSKPLAASRAMKSEIAHGTPGVIFISIHYIKISGHRRRDFC